MFRLPMRQWGDQLFWPLCIRLLGARNGGAALLPHNVRAMAPGIHADLVYFKTHIRSFYCDAPVTLKLGDPLRASSSSRICNEIDIRRELTQTRHVRVPDIKSHGAVDGTHFLLEEMIMEKGHDIDRHCPKALGEALLEFYLANGAQLVTPAEALDIDAEIVALQRHASDIGFALPESAIRFVRDEIENLPDDRNHLLCGIRHGDLTPSNLLFDGDRLFMFDWEHADRGMVFSDIARLCVGRADLTDRIVDATQAWAAGQAPSMMAPESQIALGAIVAINRRMTREPSNGAGNDGSAWISAYRKKATGYLALVDRMAMRRMRKGRLGGFMPVLFDDIAKIADDVAHLLDDIAMCFDDVLRYGHVLWPHLADGKLF
jgi:hypothetical protein